ncbi:MAG: toprim domain-containing protein, partial [Vigna little leaf phytoplasma]|nr:toprim domain-containing protein [Vigna little leaf phytoplasma]
LNKYLFNKETFLFRKSNLLYRLSEHTLEIEKKKEIIVCEGFFDVIAFYQLNIKNVVATLGTDLNIRQINLLKSLSNNVTLAYDGDVAGREATNKIALNLNKKGFRVYILIMPKNVDPDQYIRENRQNKNLYLNLFYSLKKDYIFYIVEQLQQNKQNINDIKSYINNLLKFQTKENQKYYQENLYIKYQIDIQQSNIIRGFLENVVSKKYVMKNYNFAKKTQLLPLNTKLIFQEMHESIDDVIKKQKKYINPNEFYMLLEVCLNKSCIETIQQEIKKYYFHPDILELIQKIQDYYIQYPEKEILDIDHFIIVYKEFLDNINNYFDVYNILRNIKNNPFFKNKRIINSQNDLQIFYLLLKIEHKNQKKKDLRAEIKTLSSKIAAIDSFNYKIDDLFHIIYSKELQIRDIEYEINQIFQKIEILKCTN